MQFFYDGQIRRYITQIIRLMSNFSYKDGDGVLRQIPVMYGDMTRQVAHIVRDNSENKIPSAPRMAIYITNLEMARDRLADATYVSKIHVRERQYDESGKEYLNVQGANYTVERLMPTPYTLGVSCDIWSTNTEQKLQILEQVMMLFNPSLEIQTTDNYIDWTSLSVVDLTSVQFSGRTIPTGTESEIDVATLGFTTPIWISPPTKVKKLGVVTQIITSIYNEKTGNIDLSQSMPELQAYQDDYSKSIKADIVKTADGKIDTSVAYKPDVDSVVGTTGIQYDILVMNNIAQIIQKGVVGNMNWNSLLERLPGDYKAGISTIYLNRKDVSTRIVGTFAVNTLNENQLIINWDTDSIPTDSVIQGYADAKGTVDFIVDPSTYNPLTTRVAGQRLLLLGPVGDAENQDGPDAWKGNAGDFVAEANDIVEWNGTDWTIIFNASANNLDDSTAFTPTYITNLNTGIQYKWDGANWLLSFEGEYRKGTWNISL